MSEYVGPRLKALLLSEFQILLPELLEVPGLPVHPLGCPGVDGL